MRLNNRRLLLLFLAATVAVSFSPAKKKGFTLSAIEKNMQLIPGSIFIPGVNDKSSGYIGSGEPNVASPFDIELGGGGMYKVDTFYLCKYEVSNLEYRSFLDEIQKSGDTTLYKAALWDTLAWYYFDPSKYILALYYHNRPLFNDFPAVNMTHEGAVLFCKWLTQKYNTWPKRKFKRVIFKLPDELEWMVAAGGNAPFLEYSLTDKKGRWAANFKVISQTGIIGREIEETDELTGKTTKKTEYEIDYVFKPNSEFTKQYVGDMPNQREVFGPRYNGLYNMAGNVAEMLAVKGLTKGGSWNSTGFFLKNTAREQYNDTLYPASPFKGFRIAMQVLER